MKHSAAIALAILLLPACSMMPASTIDATPPPAGFTQASECQAHPTVEPALTRPATIPARQTGWVAMTFDLFSQGRPSNIQVLDSSPKGLFVKAAIEAMSHAAFVPDSERRVGCRYVMVYPATPQ